MVPPLLSSTIARTKIFYIQCRNSRHSVTEFRKRRELLKHFRIDNSTTETENVYEKLAAPIEQIVPVTPAKTSITIDVLNEDTYPLLSQWRKDNIVRRARRVLPLPISLTTDDKLGYTWKQRYIRSLRSKQRNRNEDIQAQIPNFIKLMNENKPEFFKEKFPELYEKYKEIEAQLKQNSQPLIESKTENPMYFPFSQTLKEFDKGNESLSKRDEKTSLTFGDQEYENYLKHNELLQYLASNYMIGGYSKYQPEIKSWASQIWLRNYGNSDASIPPSKIPCSGCGAHLHCTSPNIPGFMPSQKFTLFNNNELANQKCQRCEFLTKYNVSLNVTVSDDEYPNLISKIQTNKSLVVILVDLLDYPCSVWPGIINLIGEKHLIYIVGNKVDLLPKDDKLYLERIKKSLKETLKSTHINRETKIRDVSLISAKTGYGVDNLVTKLLRDLKDDQDIFLIGCTNAGKSTLFNTLMQSDLCALGDSDLMNRATTSIWPGTTINLLKFPIRKMKGWEMEMRLNRLRLLEKHDIAEVNLLRNLSRQSKIRYAHLSERLDTSMAEKSPFIMESHHPLVHTVKRNKAFEKINHSNFLNDTPGVIYKDQLLNLLTTEELLRTIPREIITPRTYTIRPGQTLFIGGLSRIDLTHARQHVWITVFASLYLPVNIVYTEQAKWFYETHLGTEFLAVPLGNYERLQYWPRLSPKEIQLNCIGWEQSCADVVLSSAGWISITGNADTQCVLKAFTPEGRGIYVRNEPMLPYAVRLRGKRIFGTPCFENKLYTIDDLFVRHMKPGQTEPTRKLRKSVKVINEERLRNAVKFLN